MIKTLQDSIPTAVIACADWLGEEANLASIRNVGVIKNSVDREFWQAISLGSQKVPAGGVRNLFMCRDLRDKQKVNWRVLQRVAALSNQSLTIVGDHAPQIIQGVRRHASVSDRAQLAKLMQEHDRLVFTSNVDYFPLTIAEALTSGLEVDALDSQAAREFSTHPNLNIFQNEDALLSHLANEPQERQSALSNFSGHQDFFDPERMTNEYVNVYNSLLGL